MTKRVTAKIKNAMRVDRAEGMKLIELVAKYGFSETTIIHHTSDASYKANIARWKVRDAKRRTVKPEFKQPSGILYVD